MFYISWYSTIHTLCHTQVSKYFCYIYFHEKFIAFSFSAHTHTHAYLLKLASFGLTANMETRLCCAKSFKGESHFVLNMIM